MTFYWWSHWFWITLLSNILILIAVVQTYPSQEISLEYNQNSGPQKTVTKLYQTATTLTWASTAAPNTKAVDTIGEKTILQSVTPAILRKVADAAELPSTTIEEVDVGTDELVEETDATASIEEPEFKRSAESYNKTVEDAKSELETIAESGPDVEDAKVVAMRNPEHNVAGAAAVESAAKLKRDDGELNNYTNFSSAQNVTSANAAFSSTENATLTQQPPATWSRDNAHATLEWLNAMAAAAAPPTIALAASQLEQETVTVPQRIPFTLENANKEEELRRAENEHRSRKSKVLSAEYKHINRFINYSADTKSLLTRSASTAPNDFDDDGDESNISSEALSIQRTYFLDAGAISAICFTIFGVCCTVGTIGIVLYRRRYLNKPQALSEPDSSVYIDDSTMRVSDNSDEMYSLDNDSFLNSLEAMTIQNYWTDTVKHTKL